MPNCQTCKCRYVCGRLSGFEEFVAKYPNKLTIPNLRVDPLGLVPTSDAKQAIGEFLATQLCGNYIPEEG